MFLLGPKFKLLYGVIPGVEESICSLALTDEMVEAIAKQSTAYALTRTQLPIEIPVDKDYPERGMKKNPSYLHPKKYTDITK